jgi:hypothetical protein
VIQRAALAGAAAVSAIAMLAAVHRYGPPPAHTGGFGERTCHECHFDNDPDSPGGTLAVRGFPGAYEPGRAYVLEIVLTRSGTGRGGFQLAIRHAEGDRRGTDAGIMEPGTPGVVLVDTLGVHYAQHTTEATTPVTRDTIRWTVHWTAPDAGSGRIALNVAANAANNDDSPFGDYVYALEERTIEKSDTAPSVHSTDGDRRVRARE